MHGIYPVMSINRLANRQASFSIGVLDLIDRPKAPFPLVRRLPLDRHRSAQFHLTILIFERGRMRVSRRDDRS